MYEVRDFNSALLGWLDVTLDPGARRLYLPAISEHNFVDYQPSRPHAVVYSRVLGEYITIGSSVKRRKPPIAMAPEVVQFVVRLYANVDGRVYEVLQVVDGAEHLCHVATFRPVMVGPREAKK